jgi:transcriptional regulator with XRE-family HTH domain
MLRNQLDRQVAPWRTLRPFRPAPGWITATRRAIGLSARMLADRMGVDRGTVARLEKREMTEEISLRSLRLVAEAMLASGQQGRRFAREVDPEAVRTRLIDDLVSGDPRRLWRPGG